MMIAYTIKIGQTTFYLHKTCFDDATRENVNNLTPEQMAATEKAYTELPLEQVPDDAVCSKPYCWQPIKTPLHSFYEACIDLYAHPLGYHLSDVVEVRISPEAVCNNQNVHTLIFRDGQSITLYPQKWLDQSSRNFTQEYQGIFIE